LIEAESGFRKIRNYSHLEYLVEVLENFSPPPEDGKIAEMITHLLTKNT
jgi:hypothetical protein